ncbi:exodeoxyribonuclease V alpha subunit [Pseudomonas sp. S30_BP2TU TE3576]|uniref:AAA family ATPase n=1 Tax=Pseudomonas sp. S30_BP2TU TE3576 TaxID=3349329 RepID=UPI003D22723E
MNGQSSGEQTSRHQVPRPPQNQRLIRVLSIRCDNPLGYGGCIFFGIEIDERGSPSPSPNQFVVVARSKLLKDVSVEVGQWWRVSGEANPYTRVVNGFRVVEQQIDAEDLQMTLPTGHHIISLLAEGGRFASIGNAKATRLWETFGATLTEILDRGDTTALATVQGVSPESAQTMVEAWHSYRETPTLHWLHKHGFNVALGKKIIEYFGTQTSSLIEEDPYRLLSFLASWSTTDSFARTQFGVADDDPRRLQAAIEEALYRLFADGHTAATRQMVMARLSSILGDQTSIFQWRPLAIKALESGLNNGSYLVDDAEQLHQIGAYVMESAVSKTLLTHLSRDHKQLQLDAAGIDAIINGFEIDEQLLLTDEQRQAIHMAANNSLALITGGAGTGKTVVLKALYRVYDQMHLRIIQGAVAGLAAKRMYEATNRPAATIASLLLNVKDQDLVDPCVLVLDEASMVDIITMYRIVNLLPDHARILMVGDPHQLMPVGPGLVLHALVNVPQIPNTELKVVKRHGGSIASTAASIREGVWPEMSAEESQMFAFLPIQKNAVYSTNSSNCKIDEFQGQTIASEVLRLYLQAPDITQILSPRKKGDEGVHALNKLCQCSVAPNAPNLMVWSKEFDCLVETKFRLGDPVVCLRNLWNVSLQNGSLGRVTQIEHTPLALRDDEGRTIGYAIAWVDWDDGIRRPVTEDLLNDLDLAYALTVHKAQGSQWPRVIVSITGNRYLDRSLIYTAITRAQQQVLLVGDEAAARRAVQALPHLDQRCTGVLSMLTSIDTSVELPSDDSTTISR